MSFLPGSGYLPTQGLYILEVFMHLMQLWVSTTVLCNQESTYIQKSNVSTPKILESWGLLKLSFKSHNHDQSNTIQYPLITPEHNISYEPAKGSSIYFKRLCVNLLIIEPKNSSIASMLAYVPCFYQVLHRLHEK